MPCQGRFIRLPMSLPRSVVRALCIPAILAALFLHPGSLKLFAQSSSVEPAQKIVIDTDIGDDIDDAFAVALALRTPQFQILAITTTFGDTQLRAHLVLRLLEAAGRSEIPVAAGIPTPPATAFTQAEYAGGDQHKLSSAHAVDVILSEARKYPGQVTLLALGPLVNVGAAIERDPASFRKLKRVVMMGGSIDRGYDEANGVPSPAPSPEWNVRNDVAGARALFASGVPVYLMPLDATQIEFPVAMQQELLSRPNPLDHALQELRREWGGKIPVLYDPLTTAYAQQPALCPTRPMHIDVDDKGYTRQTPGAPNASVCLHSDSAGFLKLFDRRLAAPAN
jgi:inosine-uridine nucleoside N-ribohydrolase